VEESDYIIKRLAEPWDRKLIKWRVGSVNKAKDKTIPLAYVDARIVMDKLDSIIGAINWQDKYEFDGKRVICYLSLRLNGEWITKADGAGDSNIEGEKGGLSDAFKRASVKWGLGRELYDLKAKWMPIDEYGKLVGDPWNYLIKKIEETKVDEKPSIENLEEVKLKAEPTPEQKLKAATDFTDAYMKKLLDVKDQRDLDNLNYSMIGKTTYESRLKCLKEVQPNLHKKIEEKITEITKQWLEGAK